MVLFVLADGPHRARARRLCHDGGALDERTCLGRLGPARDRPLRPRVPRWTICRLPHQVLRRHLSADRVQNRCPEADGQGDPDWPGAGRDLPPDHRRADRPGRQSHRRVRRSPGSRSVSRHQQAGRGAVAHQPRRRRSRCRRVPGRAPPFPALPRRTTHGTAWRFGTAGGRGVTPCRRAATGCRAARSPIPRRVSRRNHHHNSSRHHHRRRRSPSSSASWPSCTGKGLSPMPNTNRNAGSCSTGSERPARRHGLGDQMPAARDAS